MSGHEKVIQKGQEKKEHKYHQVTKNLDSSSDLFHSQDTNLISIGETPFNPPHQRHLMLISRALNRQKSMIFRQLQQTYGNRYVQDIVQSLNEQVRPALGESDRLSVYEIPRLTKQTTYIQSDQIKDSTKNIQLKESSIHKKKKQCHVIDVFSELDPGLFIPSAYFRNGNIRDKGSYSTELEASRKDNCSTDVDFPISLNWDLGNPKLGSKWGIDINKNSKSVTIRNQIIHNHQQHDSTFTGKLEYALNINATRIVNKGKSNEKIEKGRTEKPLTGSASIGGGNGEKCCTISNFYSITQWLGDEEISIDISGYIKIDGNILRNK